MPEGLSRELRGRGLAAWAHENVLQPLAELQAPPGTVRVSGEAAAAAPLQCYNVVECKSTGRLGLLPPPLQAWLLACAAPLASPSLPSTPPPWQVLIAPLDGRRRSVLLPSGSGLHAVQRQVQLQAGLAPERQRLLVLQLRPLSKAQRVALALLRLLLGLLLWAAGWAAVAFRWLLDLPPPNGPVELQLTTGSGREVTMVVSADMTLAELQELVSEQHPGAQLDLRQLALSPGKPGGSGGTPDRGGCG